MRSEAEQAERDREFEELKKAEVGTVVPMGCTECEGLEDHEKQEDGTWKCTWCGARVIKIV